MRKFPTLAVALLASAIVLAGCVPPPPAPPEPVAPIERLRNLPVGFQSYVFNDLTRGIPALDDFPGTAVRPIPTSVWYPTDGAHGPYPLVVFAHGYGADPGSYAPLLARIASAGYVVAAPTYPILSGWPAGPSDFVDWGAKFEDTWFVTTSVLDLSANGDPILGGM